MIKSLTFFPNGIVAVFDENGEQMGDIQIKGWIDLYLERLEADGYDPTLIPDISIFIHQTWHTIHPFKLDDGRWTYRIVLKNTKQP